MPSSDADAAPERRDSAPTELREIADRVLFCRRRADMTQVVFADSLGVTPRTVQNYESGATHLPSDLVPKIEHLGRVPAGWLLSGVGQVPE